MSTIIEKKFTIWKNYFFSGICIKSLLNLGKLCIIFVKNQTCLKQSNSKGGTNTWNLACLKFFRRMTAASP